MISRTCSKPALQIHNPLRVLVVHNVVAFQIVSTETRRKAKWLIKVFFFRYHTGSLAFGAAIIAIVQFIRAVLEYIDHKLKGVIIVLINPWFAQRLF